MGNFIGLKASRKVSNVILTVLGFGLLSRYSSGEVESGITDGRSRSLLIMQISQSSRDESNERDQDAQLTSRMPSEEAAAQAAQCRTESAFLAHTRGLEGVLP